MSEVSNPTRTPEEIAAGLTEAQRRAVRELPDRFSFFPVKYSRVTIKRLIEKGLLVRTPPASGFGMVVHEWSELGAVVRAILEQDTRHGG
jgi:hypothetical protein